MVGRKAFNQEVRDGVEFFALRAGNYNNNSETGLGYLNMNNDITDRNAFRSAFLPPFAKLLVATDRHGLGI